VPRTTAYLDLQNVEHAQQGTSKLGGSAQAIVQGSAIPGENANAVDPFIETAELVSSKLTAVSSKLGGT
jgi:hypothetical protein